jgi:hypothetical protein
MGDKEKPGLVDVEAGALESMSRNQGDRCLSRACAILCHESEVPMFFVCSPCWVTGSVSPERHEGSVKTSPERDMSISQLVDGGNEGGKHDEAGETERAGGREYPGSIPLAANTHLPVVEQPILVGYFPLTLFIAVVGDGVPIFDPGMHHLHHMMCTPKKHENVNRVLNFF